MGKIIKLHYSDKVNNVITTEYDEVYINTDKIICFWSEQEHTKIYIDIDHKVFVDVKETPEDIMKLISED
jgi:hypothetical protein